MTGKQLIRVDRADHPNRCQWADHRGQCWNHAVEGYESCPRHGGRTNKAMEKRCRAYQLDIIQNSDEYLACEEINHTRPLRIELAQLRTILQQRMKTFTKDASWDGGDSVNNIQTAIAKLYRVEKEVQKWLTGCWRHDQLIKMTHEMMNVAEQYVGEDLNDLRSQALSIINELRVIPDESEDQKIPDVVVNSMGLYSDDFKRFYETDRRRSLVEEVALARYTVMQQFKMCQSPSMLPNYSGAIVKTIETVAALLKEAIRLDVETKGWIHVDEIRPVQEKLGALILPKLKQLENFEDVADRVVNDLQALDAKYTVIHE